MPESHLNGAYYGPSIPPSKSYHRPGRGGGSSCNPCSCCLGCLCNCIWSCIFQILCTIVVVLGIIILVLWLIFRPNKVKFYATDASLTQFEFNSTNNNTLYYNLALNMTIRNPNKRIGIYYDTIEASAIYQGQRLKTVQLDPFYQRHKNTSSLHAVFQGQNVVVLGSDEMSHYNENRNSGMYDIDVKLYLRIRLKFGVFKSPKVKPKIECDLAVPLNSNGGSSSSGTFESKRCGLDW